MNQRLTALGMSALVVVVSAPLLAHHSEFAQFDITMPVEVTGVVTKVEWTNPHIWFYVDVEDESGEITTWGFSGLPPGMLVRTGFTKDTLKLGDVVNVRGFKARDGSNNASSRSLTLPDGREVFPGALEVGTSGPTR